MKKYFLLSIIVFVCFFSFLISVFAVSYPKAVGYVNDFAALYSQEFRANLESQLQNFEKEKSAEFSVVTINTLEGEPIEDYAVKLFEQWKIGKKGADNGLLLLISKEDREVRIEVGYGLEPYITDGRAGDIIRNVLTPEFKNANYEKGTMDAVLALEKYIADKDVAPKNVSSSSGKIGDWFVPVIIMGYFFITYLASFLGRSKAIWPGGVIGAVFGIIGGLVAGSIITGILFAVFGGGFGLLMDYFLSKNYKEREKSGKPTSWFGSGGGFFGGGGFGGGSSGGGFGGFGGGSSGGGGASGKW
jgi:uncharacterized protein